MVKRIKVGIVVKGCELLGGIDHAESIKSYLDRFWKVGLQTLDNLIEKLSSSDCPVDCIIYDAFMPWGFDVAKKFGIHYHVHRGLIKLPVTETQILVPGLPPLEPQDLPSFIYHTGTYPDFFDMLLDQFSNIDRADWVFCNSFYMLKREVWWQIGLPSFGHFKALDKLYRLYLKAEQMEELAWGLKTSDCYFLRVVRASEESKLSKDFAEESSAKSLVTKAPTQSTSQMFGTWESKLRWMRETIESCIREILEGEEGEEIKRNASKWKELAKEAVKEGASYPERFQIHMQKNIFIYIHCIGNLHPMELTLEARKRQKASKLANKTTSTLSD
ncbi:hypothetical protein D5086_027004 [Populus alba]|uniref:Uncharacterized protein n=1 Tax=Populus alba TaxID=43335 RepID=A0ACC4B426_POPAL